MKFSTIVITNKSAMRVKNDYIGNAVGNNGFRKQQGTCLTAAISTRFFKISIANPQPHKVVGKFLVILLSKMYFLVSIACIQ